MMDKFKKIGEKVGDLVESKQKQLKRTQTEKYYIDLFTDVDREIFMTLESLNESPQLNNAIALGNAYRQMCEKIGDDDTFRGMFKFLTLVRNRDREMDKTIDWYKQKFEFSNKDKFRVEGVHSDNYLSMANRFFQAVNSYKEELKAQEDDKRLSEEQKLKEKQERIEAKQREQLDRDKENLNGLGSGGKYPGEEKPIEKAKEWINYKLHPELIPENQDFIKEYRQKMTPEQQKAIQKDMDPNKEVEIFQNVAKEYIANLFHMEEVGYYNHVKLYAAAWIKYLDTISQKEHVFEKAIIRSAFRARYIEVENWMERVNRKYEDGRSINPKEPALDPKEIEIRINQHQKAREIAIIEEENARIWNLIKNGSKIKANEEKAKQREEEQKRKAQEDEERAKQREIEKQEKEKLKAEQDKLKAEQAKLATEQKEKEKLEKDRLKAEQEKQKAEQAKLAAEQKEKEKLEKERLKAEQEKQKAEQAKLATEQKEKEKLEKDRLKAEQAKLAAEQKEKERSEQEKQKTEQEKQNAEQFRLQAEKLETERKEAEKQKNEQEKVEQAKKEAEQKEKERLDAEKLKKEQDTKLAEQKEKERLEAEKQKSEQIKPNEEIKPSVAPSESVESPSSEVQDEKVATDNETTAIYNPNEGKGKKKKKKTTSSNVESKDE